jgi:hypothetical protein
MKAIPGLVTEMTGGEFLAEAGEDQSAERPSLGGKWVLCLRVLPLLYICPRAPFLLRHRRQVSLFWPWAPGPRVSI